MSFMTLSHMMDMTNYNDCILDADPQKHPKYLPVIETPVGDLIPAGRGKNTV